MATFERLGPRYRCVGACDPEVREYPEAATQTFDIGDMVELVNGKVTLIVAAGNTAGSGDKVLGMAMTDATGTTDTAISVVVANAMTHFLFPVWHTTAGSAVTAVTDIGTSYALGNRTVSSVTNYVITLDDTTDTHIVPVEIADNFAVGEQYGWEWCLVKSAARQFN